MSSFHRSLLLIFFIAIHSITLSITGTAQAQPFIQSPQEIPFYPINAYRFFPNAKKVSMFGKIGGVNWDGYGLIPMHSINYTKTALVFINNYFTFKELIENVDLSTVKIIYPKEVLAKSTEPPYSNVEISPVLMDKNSIIYVNNLDIDRSTIIPIPPSYKQINLYLWKDRKNNIYFVPRVYEHQYEENGENTNIFQLPINYLKLDPNSLTHIVSAYFTDKNGLYWLGGYSDRHGYYGGKYIKLADSHKKNIKATLHGTYIVYDHHIFPQNYSGIYPCTKTMDDILKIVQEQTKKQKSLSKKINKAFLNPISLSHMKSIDFNLLPQIADTNFYTNGREIIYRQDDPNINKDFITNKVDFHTLKIIKNDLLLDKNNIYVPYYPDTSLEGGKKKLFVISRHALRMKIITIDITPYSRSLLK